MILTKVISDQLDSIYNLLDKLGNVPKCFTKSYLWENIQLYYFICVYYSTDSRNSIKNVIYHFAEKDDDIFEEWLIQDIDRMELINHLINNFNKSIYLNTIDENLGRLNNYHLSSIRREMFIQLNSQRELSNKAIMASDLHKYSIISLLSQEWWTKKQAGQFFKVTNQNPQGINKIIIERNEAIAFGHAAFDEHKSWINAIYVDNKYRGQGIGQMVLESLLFSLREKGIYLVGLGVGEENLKAIQLYKSLGFCFSDFKRWRFKIK